MAVMHKQSVDPVLCARPKGQAKLVRQSEVVLFRVVAERTISNL